MSRGRALHLDDYAPQPYRNSMIEKVPLHRAIHEA